MNVPIDTAFMSTEPQTSTPGLSTTTGGVLEMCENMTVTENCPDFCPPGQVCNGTDCVYMAECPCIINGEVFKVC